MAWTPSPNKTITTDRQSEKIYNAGTASGGIRFQNVSGSTMWLNTGADAEPRGGSYRLLPNDCSDETFLPPDADIFIYGPVGAEFTLKYN